MLCQFTVKNFRKHAAHYTLAGNPVCSAGMVFSLSWFKGSLDDFSGDGSDCCSSLHLGLYEGREKKLKGAGI